MSFAVRRLLVTIPLLLAISLVVFGLAEAIPGDPSVARFGLKGNPEEVARWKEQVGLNDPFVTRWTRYVSGVVTRFDFGTSYKDDRPVGEALGQKLQATFELSVVAMLLAVAVGLTVGVLSAVYPRTPLDYLGSVMAVGGISIPVFWLGMLFILAAKELLGIPFNAGRYNVAEVDVDGFSTHLYLFESLFRFRWDVFGSCAKSILLPALTLSTIPMAVITRMTRSAMLEEIRKDYATTARAKGLRSRRVILRHVLRNALIPVTTITGLQFGMLLGGAVLTETVFEWPGLGRFIVEQGVRGNDTPIIVGGILLVATMFILINLLVDLLYAVIDPRVGRA